MKITFIKSNSYLSKFYLAFGLLDSHSKTYIRIIIFLNFFLALFDILAISLFGLAGSIIINGVANIQNENFSKILSLMMISELNYKSQVFALVLISTSIFVLRTYLGTVIVKKNSHFLGKISALLSSEMFQKLFQASISTIRAETQQSTIVSLTRSANSQTLGIIGTGVGILSDLFLMFSIFLLLLILNPWLTIVALFLLSSLNIIAFKFMNSRFLNLTKQDLRLSIESNEHISVVLDFYREIRLRGTAEFYGEKFKSTRLTLSKILARISYYPIISRQVIENIFLVLGLVLISIPLLSSNLSFAAGSTTAFAAATFRLAPTVLRLQQGWLTFKSHVVMGESSKKFLQRLVFKEEFSEDVAPLMRRTSAFHIQNVGFAYPNSGTIFLSDITLEIPTGSLVYLVGKSGSGKSTFLDLLMGFHDLNQGKVRIFGLDPKTYIRDFPGKIAYVAQSSRIFPGTILDNLLLGLGIENFQEQAIWEALRLSSLDSFVTEQENGLLTQIGEGGRGLSGGQIQRLAFARAIITKPKILVLDEFSSSLDKETSAILWDALQTLKGNTTILISTHQMMHGVTPDISIEFNQLSGDSKSEIEVKYLNEN
jgi:ABC-type multidrug transport system fused ATPase/permease subunit